MAKKSKNVEVVEIPKLELKTVNLTIEGDSSLVCHAWSEKAKRQMLDKQMKKATKGHDVKDPEADYLNTLYAMDGKPIQSIDKIGKCGFPSIAFKSAAVRAGNDVGMKMTELRRAFHVLGDLVEIKGKPRMREDMVRVGMGTDLRYRAEFPKWSVVLKIRFNQQVISAEQIVNIFNTAGFGVGVGEHRPEKNGAWGMFHVA